MSSALVAVGVIEALIRKKFGESLCSRILNHNNSSIHHSVLGDQFFLMVEKNSVYQQNQCIRNKLQKEANMKKRDVQLYLRSLCPLVVATSARLVKILW